VALAYARAEYRIQPADTVKLVVYRGAQVAPEYDQQITVQPDGRIFLVGIEKAVMAQGLTMGELQATVTKEYAQLIQPDGGRFFVSVQFLTSTKAEWVPDQVYFSGQIRRPGPIPYRRGFTVMQAIAQAGGWLGTANESRVVLLRMTADGRTVSRELDLGAVIAHTGDDVELFPGDVVHVPLSFIAQLNIWMDLWIRGLIPINPSTIRGLLLI
jgi:polysaccharide export outer membrane protein